MTLDPSALRVLHFGMKGPDVLAAQRALRKALLAHNLTPANRQSRFYGEGTVHDVLRLQHWWGMKRDGSIGPLTWKRLMTYVDAYGKWLLKRAPKPLPPEGIARQRVIHQCMVLLALAPRRYAQERPYPDTVAEFIRRGSDCSGTAELACETAGVPDPNNSNYNGQAWTQSQDKHGERINESAIQGAEFTFYEQPSGHVVVELGDGTVFSHGSEGGPRRLPRHYRGDYSQTRKYPLV